MRDFYVPRMDLRDVDLESLPWDKMENLRSVDVRHEGVEFLRIAPSTTRKLTSLSTKWISVSSRLAPLLTNLRILKLSHVCFAGDFDERMFPSLSELHLISVKCERRWWTRIPKLDHLELKNVDLSVYMGEIPALPQIASLTISDCSCGYAYPSVSSRLQHLCIDQPVNPPDSWLSRLTGLKSLEMRKGGLFHERILANFANLVNLDVPCLAQYGENIRGGAISRLVDLRRLVIRESLTALPFDDLSPLTNLRELKIGSIKISASCAADFLDHLINLRSTGVLDDKID